MDEKSRLCLNDKEVGVSCVLVAEAGATHTGIESAKKLVDIAIKAKFDAVKFQRIDAEKIDNKDEVFGSYCRYDIIKQRELTDDEWDELAEYCKGRIFMFYTVSETPKKCAETYKIASRWIKDLDLIKSVAEKCDVIQIDTGGAGLLDIRDALEVVGDTKCILHHCPSGYPTTKENLAQIKKLRDVFRVPVAYSSHGRDIEPDIMALAMGACMIEKPIMEWDSGSISPETDYALFQEEAMEWIKKIRKCERMK